MTANRLVEIVGYRMRKIELEFMPNARRWRIIIDGKAFPRRFFDRATAKKALEKQKALELTKPKAVPNP